MHHTRLSVNVNKVAVLRNSRGGRLPDVVQAARTILDAGAEGITVHPRPDQRHIRADDVHALARLCSDRVEFNIEGNPFAPAQPGYPGLLELCAAARPQQVTLVPDGDGQLTSDHGFDLQRDAAGLAPLVARFKELGARVSVFVDAGSTGFAEAADAGIDRIEIYTGPYAEAFASGDADRALGACRRTAEAALAAGLGINAGHDLDQDNLGTFVRAVPGVAEVSIGHALISDALYAGLATTVERYLRILRDARS